MTDHVIESSKGVLFKILSSWTNFIEVILFAIFVSFAVDIIANGTILYFQISPLLSILIGSVICFFALIFLLTRILKGKRQLRSFEGFFIYDGKQNELVEVPRHSFSNQLCEYFECGFLENNALKTIWEKEPLRKVQDSQESCDSSDAVSLMLVEQKNSRSYKLISEATEYFILSQLSTHLCDYFNHEKFGKENLQTFLREDIPDVLLKNRFLKLFSMPMEERSAFVEDSFQDVDEQKATVLAFSKEGALYEKFDLILPEGSNTRRINDGAIEIETKRFTLRFTVNFDGYNTFIPNDFHNHYLNIDKKNEQIEDFLIIIKVSVIFKFGAFISQTGWDYYRWVDSFLESLDKNFSQRRFFEDIGWQTASTIIQFLLNGKNHESLPDNISTSDDAEKNNK